MLGVGVRGSYSIAEYTRVWPISELRFWVSEGEPNVTLKICAQMGRFNRPNSYRHGQNTYTYTLSIQARVVDLAGNT